MDGVHCFVNGHEAPGDVSRRDVVCPSLMPPQCHPWASVLDGLGRVDGHSDRHVHLVQSVHAARGTSAIKLPFLTQGATAPGSGPNGSGLAQPV